MCRSSPPSPASTRTASATAGSTSPSCPATRSFEQVAELLWTGELPAAAVRWADPGGADVRLARRVAGITARDELPAMGVLATTLGVRYPDDDAPAAARRLLQLLPPLFGPHDAGDGPLATRLARCWSGDDADDALGAAVDRALVLLADHELATSTLAVRVAASTWTAPYAAYLGRAGRAPGCAPRGSVRPGRPAAGRVRAARGVGRRRRSVGGAPAPPWVRAPHLPRGGPTPAPHARRASGRSPIPTGRCDVVDDLLIEAGIRLTQRPNVDLGLGALSFVAGFPPAAPVFAVARLAGFAAHYLEERNERPLRFRGVARQVEE